MSLGQDVGEQLLSFRSVQISQALAAIRSWSGGHVLLADSHGHVLDHATAAGPGPVLVQTVLGKDIRPIEQAATSPRTVAVCAAGPVVEVRVAGDRALAVPLGDRYARLGHLWVIAARPDLPPSRLLEDALALTALVTASPGAEEPALLAALLQGAAELPPTWRGLPVTVLVLRGAEGTEVQSPGLRRAARQLGLACLLQQRDQRLDVLLAHSGGTARSTAAALLARASSNQLAAGVAGPTTDVAELPRLHAQAEAAADVAPLGSVVAAAQARADIAVRAAVRALESLSFMDDLVAPLSEYDRRRRTELVPTLLAWMEAGRDVAATSAALQLHVNTVRYRLRRAGEVLQLPLDDSTALLALHLYLRRVTSSSGA